MDAMGSMRDLDQIQERDDGSHTSRLMSIALGAAATACVLFAVGVMVGREAGDAHPATHEDPLAQLDRMAQHSETAAAPLTYADRLTGPSAGATPMAAAASAAPAATTALPALAPAATAGGTTVVGPSIADPSHRPVLLPQSASPLGGFGVRLNEVNLANAGTLPPTSGAHGPPVAAGSDGAFTVQVSSFRAAAHAQTFAQRLRERGHHAFVAAAATDPNGIAWYRVRVGPFANLREANSYRTDFESRERMPAIVVRRDAGTLAAH